MIVISGDFDMDAQEETSESKMNDVYPKPGDDLVNFIYSCKTRNLEVMFCLRCSFVFDKKAAKGVEDAQ